MQDLRPVELSDATLDRLPEGVLRPTYDRGALTAGMVHIGLGNFHRAHQAWYLHRLMQAGKAQDCLTTLIELDPEGARCEVTGAMIDYLPIEEGNGALIAAMSDPAIRIVSLTVTEGGYYLHPDTGRFDTDHADIRHDAANPDRPRTAFGAMVAALAARRAAGQGPFTAMSCDNLQGNGAILRDCILGLARLSDPDLARWIDSAGAFPNSMVDCIVPATSDAVIAQARTLGIDDAAPVTHEPFRQWVIEEAFCAGRPPWEEVGATLTRDVHSYEAQKLRILNGGHQILANVGELLSVPTIADCMADADIAAFFGKVQRADIVPHVDPVPEMTPEGYLDLVERRFSNPAIRDTTRRVAFDGSSRHPGFLHQSLADGLASGGSISGLALAEAFWARMCAGMREDGTAIEANDPNWADLHAAALAAQDDPAAWLALPVYGRLAAQPRFVAEFSRWLRLIGAEGSRAAMRAYLAEG